MYTKKVLDHFKNPKNVGKLQKPDGIGKVGNVVCGDVMHLYIKVGKKKIGKEAEQEYLEDVKFETFGCAAAIATSSIITEIAKGQTLTDALNINKKSIIEALGGLPPIKIHCSVLAVDALSEAIYDYWQKNKKSIPAALAKKHQRIQKEKDIIEEKYADWTGEQEKELAK